MKQRTYTRYIPTGSVQTYCALGLLLALFAAYMYFLSFSVVHVVMRKEVMNEVSNLRSDIATLEAQYMQRQHAVSDAVAVQHGFVAVADKVFLERGTDTSVALSTNR